jgi:hypothetical protein
MVLPSISAQDEGWRKIEYTQHLESEGNPDAAAGLHKEAHNESVASDGVFREFTGCRP